MAVSDEEIQAILERAKQRRDELQGLPPIPSQASSEATAFDVPPGAGELEVDPGEVATAAAEGAGIAAAGLPAIGTTSRRGVPLEPVAPSGFKRIPTGPQAFPQGSRVNPITARTPRGKAANILMDIVESAMRNPKLFAAGEIASGAAAGAATDTLKQMGAGEGTQMAAGTAAGALGVGVPITTLRTLYRMGRWGMNNMVPIMAHLPGIGRLPGMQALAEANGLTRAARALQSQSEAPAEAAEAVMQGPAGVSPARRTGQAGLMSMEERILRDDPEMAKAFRDDLEAAAERATGELNSLYNTPRGKQDWELAIMSRVASDPSAIQPGTTDEMLDAAYKTFKGAYEPIRENVIRPQIVRPGRRTQLKTMLDNVQDSHSVDASDDTRARVGRRIRNEFSRLRRKLSSGTYGPQATAGDFLALRSRYRDLARQARRQRSDPTSADRARLYDLAADKVTSVLRSQLPPEATQQLRATDQLYRQYKTVEDAVFSAGDKPFTPDHLLRSLRRSSRSPGQYARGADRTMRQIAQAGQPISKFLANPDVARQVVRDSTPEQRQAIHTDFVREMMGRSVRQTEEGEEYLSGLMFQRQLSKYSDTADALEMSAGEQARLNRIASELTTIQRKSPEAVTQLIEDGPSSILKLLATLVSVHGAHRLGRGIGASQMVLAQNMAARTRQILDFITRDRALEILIQAQKDPELYQALLTRSTDPIREQDRAARILHSYIPAAAGVSMDDSLDMKELREDANALGVQ